jgi:dienelactone hydrolase
MDEVACMGINHRILFYIVVGLVLCAPLCSVVAVVDEPTPPGQPPVGPGGSDYEFAAIKKTRYLWGAHQYWIFEPASPEPTSAPLIIFLHGWSAMYPIAYQGWIDHLVKKGNIVVYPRYQFTFTLGWRDFFSNAVFSLHHALQQLENGPHVRPQLDHIAIVGHSLGGGFTALLAATAAEEGLPLPKAIMPVQPYFQQDDIENLSHISNETLMLVVVGNDDTIAGDTYAKMIFMNTPQIPLNQKDYVIQVTDRYGSPDLVADHYAPVCFSTFFFNTVDAMDYYSTWKLFDALTDYAFYGTNGEYCLGDTPEQRFMGLWSDGTPVHELHITDAP